MARAKPIFTEPTKRKQRKHRYLKDEGAGALVPSRSARRRLNRKERHLTRVALKQEAITL